MKKLYIISDGKYCKIGESEHIDQRMKTIQTYNPKDLQLLCSVESLSESNLHYRLGEYNIRGEWFEHNNEVDNIIEIIKDLSKLEKFLFNLERLDLDIFTNSHLTIEGLDKIKTLYKDLRRELNNEKTRLLNKVTK